MAIGVGKGLPRREDDLLLAVERTKCLEAGLERLGAKGRGLHEKAESVANKLPLYASCTGLRPFVTRSFMKRTTGRLTIGQVSLPHAISRNVRLPTARLGFPRSARRVALRTRSTTREPSLPHSAPPNARSPARRCGSRSRADG